MTNKSKRLTLSQIRDRHVRDWLTLIKFWTAEQAASPRYPFPTPRPMSYIDDYLLYSNCDEAPVMFHLWCGYATLSAAIGRRVWLPRPPNVLYGNLYLNLIGNAGGGKTQALNKARWVLAQAGVNMSASVDTVEGLIRKIAGNEPKEGKPKTSSVYCEPMVWPDGHTRDTHSITITASEFIDFIRVAPEAWTGFLNNIYDEDNYSYDTKNGGKDTIMGPYIVLIGCFPTDVGKQLQEFNIINTGFARRTIMQYGKRRFENPVAFPEFTPEQEAARTRCVERLKAVRKLHGPIVETPDARRFYKEWYDNHSRTLEGRATLSTHGWLSSKPTQVVKVSMLNVLSERDDLILTADDYAIALGWLSEMEKTMNMVFAGVGRNELAGLTLRVLDHIEVRGPVSIEHLLKFFYSDLLSGKGPQEMLAILQHLVATEHLVSQVRSVGHSGAVQTTVYATPQGLEQFDAARIAQRDAAKRNETPPDVPPVEHP